MITKDNFIKLLHNLYSGDTFINDLFSSIATVVNKASDLIITVKNEMYFDTMVYLLPYYEKIMQITPTATQTLDDRRAVIRARWMAKGHNSIGMLQNCLNSWKNGETTIDFVDGKLKITFHSIFGIPTDFTAVLDTLNIIKPAHLAYLIVYKYLLIKDIHNVLTVNQVNSLKINQFAGKDTITL